MNIVQPFLSAAVQPWIPLEAVVAGFTVVGRAGGSILRSGSSIGEDG